MRSRWLALLLPLLLSVGGWARGAEQEGGEPVRPAIEESDPQSGEIGAEPGKLEFTGGPGEAVKRLLQLTVTAEATGLELSAGILRHTDPDVWIDRDGVTITPASVPTLKPGDPPEDVVVEVTGGAAPGDYSGTLRISGTVGGLAKAIDVPLEVEVREAGVAKFGLLADGKRVEDQTLALQGLIGAAAATLQTEFTLTATRAVTGIKLTPSSFKEERRDVWIAGNSVTDSAPADLAEGESEIVTVTVSGVSAPGLYRGNLAIGHDGAGAPSAQLAVTVEAVQLAPSPEEIEFELVRPGIFGIGGSGVFETELELFQIDERPSSALMDGLRKELQVKLTPLRQEDEKSKVLRVARPRDEVGFGGDTLNLRFALAKPDSEEEQPADTRPASKTALDKGAPPAEGERPGSAGEEPAPESGGGPRMLTGSYTGTLRLSHPKLGSVAAVPVKVNVKASTWQAWLMMALGVVTSWFITYWQTTGKARNAQRGTLGRLRARVESSALTAASRRDLESRIAKGYDLVAAGKTAEADTLISEIETALPTAIDSKRALVAKAAEVEGMQTPIARTRHVLAETFQENQPVFRYLDGLFVRVERLKKEIELEVYAAATDQTLLDEVTAIKTAQTQLATVAEQVRRAGYEVDRIAAVFQRSFPTEKPIRKALDNAFVRDVREKLGLAPDEEAVTALATSMSAVASSLVGVDSAVRRLRFFQEHISSHQETGSRMAKSAKAIAAHIADLRLGQVPTASKLDELIRLISEDLGATASTRALAKTPEITKLARRDNEARIELISRVIEVPFMAKKAPKPPADEAPPVPWPQKLLDQLTPKRKERVVNILLYAVAFAITLPIGMIQTYYNDETFGGFMAYLAVFLWGFGIQTGTATAASVLTTIRGS